MHPSYIKHLNAAINHLGVVLEGFKESMLYTSGSKRFEEQVQKLHINHVNKELDKIRESLSMLRLRVVHTVVSIDAALTGAEQMKQRAKRMAIENEKKMEAFQKINRFADERLIKAEKKEAAAHATMNIAEKKMADANEVMKIAQKKNADADELLKNAQEKINDAVGLQDQADVALLTLQQNIGRCDEHGTTEAVGTMRQIFVMQKLQKINMEAEVAKQLGTNRVQRNHVEGNHMQPHNNTNEFEATLMKRWDEVRDLI